MLKKINEGGVESSQGFSIQIIGPEIMRYVDKNHTVNLDINYDSRNRKAYIYVDDVTEWCEGDKKIQIAADDKNLMIQHIREAVKLLRGDFEVV